MVINNTTLVSLFSLYTHSLVFYVESKKYESFYNQYFDGVTIRYQFQYVSDTINNTLNKIKNKVKQDGKSYMFKFEIDHVYMSI